MGENITSSRARTRVRSFLLSLSPLQVILDFITESDSGFKVPEPHVKRNRGSDSRYPQRYSTPSSGRPTQRRRVGVSGASGVEIPRLTTAFGNIPTSTELKLSDATWIDNFFPEFTHEKTGFPIMGSPDGNSLPVYSVAFSPNGERVASGSEDNTVRIWNAATGKLQRELKGHNYTVTSVAFSPKGERVASGSEDNTVRIWDAKTWQLQRELKGHSRDVLSVAFSPNGERVASGSQDNTVRIWDAATGQLQRELKGHSSVVWSVAFSPNGKRVVSGSQDTTVRIWERITSEELIQRTSGVKHVPNWVRSVVHALQEPALRITVLDCLNTIWYEVVRIGSPE